MKGFYIVMFILFTFGSCNIFNYKQKPDKTFLRILNNEKPVDGSKIALSGLYSMVSYNGDTSKIYNITYPKIECFIDPLIFYGNGLVCPTAHFVAMEKERLIHLFKNRKEFMLNSCWGVYTINDTIIESVQYVYFNGFGGNRSSWYLAHFKGILVNKYKIKDWQMIPPYPKYNDTDLKWLTNKSLVEYLKTPKDFEFRKFHTKTEIDSNAVWINKYRKIK